MNANVSVESRITVAMRNFLPDLHLPAKLAQVSEFDSHLRNITGIRKLANSRVFWQENLQKTCLTGRFSGQGVLECCCKPPSSPISVHAYNDST